MDWAEVGAIAAILALFEAPLIVLAGAAWSWARTVDRRLDAIEARSRQFRRGDTSR